MKVQHWLSLADYAAERAGTELAAWVAWAAGELIKTVSEAAGGGPGADGASSSAGEQNQERTGRLALSLAELFSAKRADLLAAEAGEWTTVCSVLVTSADTVTADERQPPTSLLRESLDRYAIALAVPGDGAGQQLICPLDPATSANHVIVLHGEAFEQDCLERLALLQPLLSGMVKSAELFGRLSGRSAALRTLVEATRRFTLVADTATLLDRIAVVSTELMGAERASIFIWDRDSRQLVGRPALGVPGGELRVSETCGIVGDVVRSGQPAVVNDVDRDQRFDPRIDQRTGFKTRNILCVPLRDERGHCIGAFQVLNKRTGRWQPDDLDTLELLAAHAGAAIQSVQERERLIRVNAQLASEARLRAEIVGVSEAIESLRANVRRLAATDLPVLILGAKVAAAKKLWHERFTTAAAGHISRLSRLTAPLWPRRYWRASCLDTRRGHSLMRTSSARASSSWRPAARFSWTK